VVTFRSRSNDSLRCWRRRALVAAVLAVLCVAAGCSESARGLKWSVTLTGSPLGLGLSVEPVPSIQSVTPAGWSTADPAIVPATVPATQP
jgi:hypothetical protein